VGQLFFNGTRKMVASSLFRPQKHKGVGPDKRADSCGGMPIPIGGELAAWAAPRPLELGVGIASDHDGSAFGYPPIALPQCNIVALRQIDRPLQPRVG
jgi:hypothetical protein